MSRAVGNMPSSAARRQIPWRGSHFRLTFRVLIDLLLREARSSTEISTFGEVRGYSDLIMIVSTSWCKQEHFSLPYFSDPYYLCCLYCVLLLQLNGWYLQLVVLCQWLLEVYTTNSGGGTAILDSGDPASRFYHHTSWTKIYIIAVLLFCEIF